MRAGHNVGKSFVAACAINWWYDCFDPGVCMTTAPTDRQVKDILWKEVRRLRRGSAYHKGDFTGPVACRLQSAEDHFAHGFTARDGDRFQGQHEAAVFVVFDEAEGVESIFWEAAETMLGGDNYAMLAIYNPTSQSGPTVEAERDGGYALVTMSAMDHPNIRHDLERRTGPPPVPNAIRLDRLREMMESWSEPADRDTPGAVQLAGKWYLPGPVAQARLLGRRPTAGYNAVFPEYLFDEACSRSLPLKGPLQIGVDPAWFGDDESAMHVRKGGVSLHHEAFQGQDTVKQVDRAESLALTWGSAFGMVDPRQEVIIAVDAVGIGAGVFDQLRARGFRRVVAVNTVRVLSEREDYPNLRSALWFGFASECKRGNIALGNLPKPVLADLRRELTAPVYEMDVRGRRLVEPKDVTKERIGRSPDNADALLLAYANVGGQEERSVGQVEVP